MQLENFELKMKRKENEYEDYDIIKNGENIGIFQIVKNEDSIFGRQIHIYENFQRKGFAKSFFEDLMRTLNVNFRFCIATSSQSAMNFWDKYLKTHPNNHIRGYIFELIPTKEEM